MSEIDPLWQLIAVAVVAFVLGRWSARAGRARQDDVVRPPPYEHPSAGSRTSAMGTTPSAPAATSVAATMSPAVMSEVRALIRKGHKIEAIKRVREETRMGLKEAKDFVESL